MINMSILHFIVFTWFVPSLCRLALGQTSISDIHCLDSERKALLSFKRVIKTDSCGLLNSWIPDTDCCQWRGVQCSNTTGHVVTLRLEGNDIGSSCLEGQVSPSLAQLKHLRHLNLSFNEFSQPVPRFLGSLTNLEYLSLSYAFDGEIPYDLGNLSMLVTLELKTSSSLHVENLEWLSRLRWLRHVDLSGVDLSKAVNWMNIVSNLPYLSVLNMKFCQLSTKTSSSVTYLNSSATLSSVSLSGNYFNNSSIFRWLLNFPGISTQLLYLDLSMNSFQGSLPDGFRNMLHLSYLDLSANHLQGPIPSEFLNMKLLKYLALSENDFQGSVLKIVSKLCSLQQLYLGGNNFTDELSTVIQGLVSCENTKGLSTLDLSRNRFWGTIPDTISSFSSLTELYLDGNLLKGAISQDIGRLSMLEKLDMSSNFLQGTLTEAHFLSLSKLRELYLSDNTRLVINIDVNWDPSFQLDIISLRSCKLGPRFPKWLQKQTNFSYLDISNAEISDSVPVSFWNSFTSNLQYLNMSYNRFYGTLPNLPEEADLLPEVDLSSNLFEGVVPSGFANVFSLYLNNNRFSDASYILCPETPGDLSELDLSNNLFSGELPNCWMNFDQLSSLHLENNRFSGNIPKSIGTLSYLQYLHLYNNSFSGQLPASLKNCSSLVILNLGYNSFNGVIPSWIGNAFPRLGALILRRNRFHGEIPVTLCQLGNLQILDVAVNQITGVIPHCVGNFTAMTGSSDVRISFASSGTSLGRVGINTEGETAIVSWKREEQIFKETVGLVKFIDLSRNELSGEIPENISSLTGLVSLDMSENKLSGKIPSEIGQLTSLELLDLSYNNLVGGIPVSLAKVSSLGILDLSNNNLSGEIPVSTQLQSFNPSSYAGNPGLCGAPLPKCATDQVPVSALREDNISDEDDHDNFDFITGLYISVVLGFVVGFWGICGTLVIKRSWRRAYFRVLDDVTTRVMRILR